MNTERKGKNETPHGDNIIEIAPRPNARSKQRAAKKPASDAALIRACVAFAQNVAANKAGYDADPTDSEYAEPMGNEFRARCDAALRKMAELHATTPEGLDAKARVVPIVISSTAGGRADGEENFFTSFAQDVQEILKPIIHERWLAGLATKPEAAS